LLIGGLGQFPHLVDVWPLLVASSCVYHGGMALNDWADRAEDAHTRPDRPIPSGALSADAVKRVGFGLLVAALLFAASCSVGAAAWMGGIVALILAYDLGGRGAWSGPLLLGACRAANLGLGLLYASTLATSAHSVRPEPWWALPLLYGAYVFSASKVARLEDGAAEIVGPAARLFALVSVVLLLAAGAIDIRAESVVRIDALALAVAAIASLGLVRAIAVRRAWTRSDCGRFTGMALRRLLIFTACLTLAHRGETSDAWIVAGLILAGFPISAGLRRWFPPT